MQRGQHEHAVVAERVGAHLAARYTSPSEASEATAASRRPQRSSQPDSAGGLVERWMPGFVKNL